MGNKQGSVQYLGSSETHQRCDPGGLHEVLKLDALDIIGWKTFRDPQKATEASTCERLIPSLTADSRRVRDVAFAELEDRGLAAADLDVEVVALYIDLRYSKLDKSTCTNGDNDGDMYGKREREELYRVAMEMNLDEDRASSPQTHFPIQAQQRDT